MALRPITHIGEMTLDDFDLHSRAIVVEMAKQIHDGATAHNLQVGSKPGNSNVAGSEVVTNLDRDAQVLYLARSKKLPRGLGKIGEEDNLRELSRFIPSIYHTIDPADGTNSMVEVVQSGEKFPPGRTAAMPASW
jgi:fructose-1,6-bisphosphatase/inositol monophosphatase family enzyme